MKPTEDDYADETTSAKEYEPGTCCVASVKIFEGSCRAIAIFLSGLNQDLQIVVSFLAGNAGCLRHRYTVRGIKKLPSTGIRSRTYARA